jgi:hypothetical protein
VIDSPDNTLSFDYAAILKRRLVPRSIGRWDVQSKLRHFALITYALPKARLAPHIPANRFEIPEFTIGGRQLALMSAVPFVDVDFHFIKLFPFLKFHFGQTNYRVYVIDRHSGEHAVWFFGTTLGSVVVYAAKGAWGIPWHYARYQTAFDYDDQHQRYRTFRYTANAKWCSARIDLADTGERASSVEGFESFAAMQLILTHPVDGHYYRADRQVGGYSVWHETIPCTIGEAHDLYFSLYERLGLLSRDEMQQPHSVLMCPETEFQVCLPPKVIR